jgi:hypothetical protein
MSTRAFVRRDEVASDLDRALLPGSSPSLFGRVLQRGGIHPRFAWVPGGRWLLDRHLAAGTMLGWPIRAS